MESDASNHETPRDLFGNQWPYGDPAGVPPGALAARAVVQAILRETANRSLRQIARDAGISHAPLQKLVHGDTWPNVRTLMKLSAALGTDLIAKLSEVEVASSDPLLDDFIASASAHGGQVRIVLGQRCGVVGVASPFLVVAIANQNADQLHRAIGAVHDCNRVVRCASKAILLPETPTRHTSDLLEVVDVLPIWRVGLGHYESHWHTYRASAA